ncbi:aminotransferase class IV family protein [Arcobacter sp. LA11]|uniref:aminotransferase class IV family protein n=1 Tax=Arcobacter sp. LA11 TaxID=1898176 RepID=UPI000932DC66|nr:aminotransferase class IV family protein [Arcobacter sp. LA11]
MYYFETIKCEDFEVLNLDYHNKRVANTIGLNINLQEYIYPPSNELLRCKVIYDEEGITDVEYFKYKKREIKSFKIIVEDKINYSKKYVNRTALDNLFNQRENADEIIIIKNDFVTDTSIANIAIHDGSSWITPKTPLLYGTTRARLIEEKRIFEKEITIDMLKNAKKFALMNAMIDFDILEDYSFFL